MEVQELRVGNFLTKYGEIVKVIDIGVKHISDNNYYIRCENDNCGYWIDQFKPIPITEEILLKCGFEKYGKYHESYKKNHFIVELCILGKGYNFRKRIDNNYSVLLQEIKYLHQLQNLYFALTNKELNIKL